MKGWPIKRIYRVPLVYCLFSVLWILFSDKIAFALSPNTASAVLFSTIKGIFFVVISTLLIYFLLRAEETGKKLLLNEMVAVQRSFNLLFEDNPQPMCIYDNQSYKIMAVNPSGCRIYGYTGTEFRKLKITDLFRQEDVPQLLKMIADHKDELRQSGPWTHLKKEGEQFMVQLISHPLNSAGINSTLVSVVDVTEHQKTLVELDSTIQQRDDYQSFGFTASHDLKAPIRAIIGYSDILHKEYHHRLDEDGNRFVNQIHKAGETMNEMLDEMLILTGINRKAMNIEQVDLSEVFIEVLNTLQLQDPKRKVTVTIQPEMRPIADMGAVKLIAQNLLQNAWKFTKQTSKAQIQIGSSVNSDGESVYYVRDNGLGFDPEAATQIFEPFKRVNVHSEFEGMGIGLSIVHRAVERHGGRVWFEAEPGKGACFYFTLKRSETMKDQSAGK